MNRDDAKMDRSMEIVAKRANEKLHDEIVALDRILNGCELEPKEEDAVRNRIIMVYNNIRENERLLAVLGDRDFPAWTDVGGRAPILPPITE